MFKKFKDIFLRQGRPDDLAQRNRQRFNAILSDRRFDFLEDIYNRLLAKDTTLADKEILCSYYKFSDNIQTNTFAAAELEWVVISVLCFYKPHLTSELIKRGLLSIVYSIGDQINAENILEFINQRILDANLEPYGGLPPDVGMKWLTEVLLAQKVMLQQALDEVIRQNRHDLENL